MLRVASGITIRHQVDLPVLSIETDRVSLIYFPSHFMNRAVESRLASLILITAFFWMVAAAGFSGFIGKWGMLENVQRNGIEAILDGTAHRPFVYRQLVPMIATFTDEIVPEHLKEPLLRSVASGEFRAPVFDITNPEARFPGLVVYYLTFLSFFASLAVLRRLVIATGGGPLAAILAPAGLVLAFPYLQTVGGYFYDSVELLFMSLAFLAAARGKLILFFILILPATLNKETFFFFLPALYPLFRQITSTSKALLIVGASILISGLVNITIKQFFSDAPGVPAEFHLFDNLGYYLSPQNYLHAEITYNLVGPGRLSIATLMVVSIIAIRGWQACSPTTRQHLLIAAAVNLPLFVSFAAGGELRNLSLLYVGFVILMANTIDRAVSKPGMATHLPARTAGSLAAGAAPTCKDGNTLSS